MRNSSAAGPVGVVGVGHVGLATAVCFAARGIKTVGFDIDGEKIRSISRGKAPFAEEGMQRYLSLAIRRKKFEPSSDPSSLEKTKSVFICVPTPASPDGSIDVEFVKSAAVTIGGVLKRSQSFKVVVVKSTVTPGTAATVVLPVLESCSGKKLGGFGLVSNPEFLREGRAIEDTLRPSRLVIGTQEGRSKHLILRLYRQFYGKPPETVLTNWVNAEMIKHASNAFLATKVSYANELANLCSKLPGADISVVVKGMALDPRIGPGSMKPGLGYGGSCLPKDVNAFLKAAEAAGVKLSVADAAQKTNNKQANVAVALAERLVGDLKGKRIALLGLSFKPESDDMRDAVSVKVALEFAKRGAHLVAYDPAAIENARRILGESAEFAKSAKECIKGADCCVVVTEWAEFSKLNAKDFRALMRNPAVVDGRRILDPKSLLKGGVKFAAVGLNPGPS